MNKLTITKKVYLSNLHEIITILAVELLNASKTQNITMLWL